jgi:hypothetical protein
MRWHWPWTQSKDEKHADDLNAWAATANLDSVVARLNRVLDISEQKVKRAVDRER